jgi:hypothetical protein
LEKKSKQFLINQMNRQSAQRINYLLSQACEEGGVSDLDIPHEFNPSPTEAFQTNLWELRTAVSAYQNTGKGTQHPEYKSLITQKKLVLASPFLKAQIYPAPPNRVRLAKETKLAIKTRPSYDKTQLTLTTQNLLERFLANLNIHVRNDLQAHITIIA